jgi:ATP-binding cassette, subfamily C, type I secretion system permease/ATPase
MKLSEKLRQSKLEMRRPLTLVAIVSILANLCLLTVPLFLFQVYDRVIFSKSVETLIVLAMVAVVILLTYGALDAVRSVMLQRIAKRFEASLSGIIISGELNKSTPPNRDTLNNLQVISSVLSSRSVVAIFDLPIAFAFLALVYFIHPVLGTVALIGIFILSAMTIAGEIISSPFLRASRLHKMEAQRKQELAYSQQEIIKSLGMFQEIVGNWSKSKTDQFINGDKANELLFVFSSFSKSFRQIIQISLIGAGAYLVLFDNLSAGIIFAASIIGSRSLAPIEGILASWNSIKAAMLALENLGQQFEKLELSSVTTLLPRPSGQIELQTVFYVSPDRPEKPLIAGVSLKVDSGEALAVIGPSGSGKSTLARLLSGYYTANRGKVTLDGLDMSAWDPVQRGLYVGYLPQAVSFLEGTVRENICRFRKNDPEGAVVNAAKMVGVHNLILGFPQGYDTIISAKGFQPSGGQRQLVGLARAFYSRPSVIILDEPNAHLDTEGEAILFQALGRAKSVGITIVIVSQRLSILNHVNKVAIMRGGRLERLVPPKELLKSNLQKLETKRTQQGQNQQGSK